LYYFERICRYKGSKILSNVFILGYNTKLLELMGVKAEHFMNNLNYFRAPITIAAVDNLQYRLHLLSHVMHGAFPRLGAEIKFNSHDRVMVLDPYASINRLYSMKDETLSIRTTYSYKDDNDIQ